MTERDKYEYQSEQRRIQAGGVVPKQQPIFPGQAVLGTLPNKGHVPITPAAMAASAAAYLETSNLTLEDKVEDQPAHGFLEEACNVMKQKAKLRDKPEGERSMEAIVNTFNALTGKNLTEGEGWEFMILLKMVRGRQGAYNRDDYVDGSAYFGLLGECESSRKK